MRNTNFAKKLLPVVPTLFGAALMLHGPSASAAAAIGLDPTGTSTYTTYADLWTNITDSALSTGFIPGALVPSPTSPYVTGLTAQARVGTMSNGPTVVTPTGLNSTFEITKVLQMNELVDQQTATTAHFTLPAGAQPDIDPNTAGSQQLMIFVDNPITDGSTAVPGNGAGTVACYGAGPTSNTTQCGTGGDGVLVLSAHVVFLDASFTALNAGVGTGSFDIRFLIDYVNPNYLDIATNSIIGDKITGTTNIPPLFTPAQMWNGLATSSGFLFKVDSSETFIVPEPGSLALLGLGLSVAGFAAARARRKS